MKTSFPFVVLVAASFLSIPAWAGTPSNPDVTDAADITQGSVDIRAAWIQSTATEVIFTMRLQDLSSESSPALDNEGALRNYYRFDFTLSSTNSRYFVEAGIHLVDTATEAGTTVPRVGTFVRTNVGTTNANGGRVNPSESFVGTTTVDAAANTITMKFARPSGFNPGAVISQISTTTYQGDDAWETDQGLGQFIGGSPMVRDTATTTKTVTI